MKHSSTFVIQLLIALWNKKKKPSSHWYVASALAFRWEYPSLLCRDKFHKQQVEEYVQKARAGKLNLYEQQRTQGISLLL